MPKTRDTILKKLRKNEIGGRACALELSRIMDSQLTALAEKTLPGPDQIALIATGGYGRQELCPFSDIDVLFLMPGKTDKKTEKAIEDFLYTVWDSRIKIGYSVRSVQDCLNVIRTDSRARTTLLDARLVWGGAALLEELNKELRRHKSSRANAVRFVRAKLAERDRRHRMLGDSRYMLEPNIKDGKGGLRDYQTMIWICDFVYRALTPETLAEKGVLSAKEARHFRKAHDFLLTVRCHLHDTAGRAEERLHFDIQPQLAERLGYTSRDNARAVERFMKHYFHVTRDIGDLTRIICAAIDAENETGIRRSSRSFLGFDIVNERLSFSPGQNIEKHPVEIMRLFRVAQDSGRDIHPAALREITRKRKTVRENLRDNTLANRIFIEILTARKDAALILRRMNEAGVLEHIVPEFRRVLALMQFDRYHVFTVDEHTLRAVDILHQIENGDLKDKAPLASVLIHDLKMRRALYVSMLLHDICKGRRGDHSQLGAELALKLCPRFGLDDGETRLVSWLIFSHLFMADIAFKRDLSDPKTLDDFLFRVYDTERLKLLTVLTTADIMAVGPGRWSGWKDQLLQSLYYLAEARLTGKEPVKGAGDGLPPFPQALGKGETEVDIRHDEDKEATSVTVFTHDCPGLFALLSGALAASGTTIIEARINTLAQNRVIDTFTVQNFSRKPLLRKPRYEEVERNIRSALNGSLDIAAGIARYARPPVKKDLVFDVPGAVSIDNRASRKDTLVEVSGRDRPGLLYDIARTLNDHGCIIRSAKINTFGLKAVDVFYLRDAGGRKITGEAQCAALSAALKSLLAGGSTDEDGT